MNEETESIDKDIEYDPIVEGLLSKYSESRDQLELDLKSVISLKDRLGTLFPDDLNFRNKFVLEEKIKSCTGFYSTILSMRQEINRSLSNEIDIRRKLNIKANEGNVIDIRKLAEQVETLQKEDAAKTE